MGMPVMNHSNTPRCQAITDIIESVAMQEAALSQILNAEGEKLQKVLCTPHVSPRELLKFNKSVQQTVRAVTLLEVVLQSKLQLFDDCLCFCDDDDDDDHDCDCDCDHDHDRDCDRDHMYPRKR